MCPRDRPTRARRRTCLLHPSAKLAAMTNSTTEPNSRPPTAHDSDPATGDESSALASEVGDGTSDDSGGRTDGCAGDGAAGAVDRELTGGGTSDDGGSGSDGCAGDGAEGTVDRELTGGGTSDDGGSGPDGCAGDGAAGAVDGELMGGVGCMATVPALTELIEAAPWREAVTFRHSWPHEYVLSQTDSQRDLLAAVCARFQAGEGVRCRFYRMKNLYLFIGDHKYWLMTHYSKINPYAGEDNYVINRARLYRDRRDFVVQPGDCGLRNHYPTTPAQNPAD